MAKAANLKKKLYIQLEVKFYNKPKNNSTVFLVIVYC